MMRQKSRKDLNQTAIVKELRELGYDVDITEYPYDIVVSGELIRWLGMEKIGVSCSLRVEIKSEKGKLSKTQQEYFEKQKHKGSLIEAHNTEEITAWFGR